MNRKGRMILAVAAVALTLTALLTPAGRRTRNQWLFQLQKADDATSYQTKKQVEDTCRAMLASYQADRLIYQEYRESESQEARQWARQAQMRANRTASAYNHYILQNSFVWAGNVPEDIAEQLEYIEGSD